MDQRFYHTQEFAQKAAVTVRTLRYYDQVGLLSPTQYSESGYRLYTDENLESLQQILALKFLGLSLEEIKICLQREPGRLQEALALQKKLMAEKRAHLETVIQAITETERLLQTNHGNWEAIVHVIQVLQMEQNKEWVKKYFTEEQQQQMAKLSEQSYSETARQKMAQWGTWTEEDQQRVDKQYAQLAAELKRLVAEGADPGSPAAQAVAKQQSDLLLAFTKGDTDIEDGLKQWWKNFSEMPEEQRPIQPLYSKAEWEFLNKALAIYKERQQPS
ncbi:MAG TPA: MerR family transcriptional regulator [Ktedonobacteraceae bacterium]|nr:MerR family transcriptional regulator [Ktedonobacteraceae bacterium]